MRWADDARSVMLHAGGEKLVGLSADYLAFLAFWHDLRSCTSRSSGMDAVEAASAPVEMIAMGASRYRHCRQSPITAMLTEGDLGGVEETDGERRH